MNDEYGWDEDNGVNNAFRVGSATSKTQSHNDDEKSHFDLRGSLAVIENVRQEMDTIEAVLQVNQRILGKPAEFYDNPGPFVDERDLIIKFLDLTGYIIEGKNITTHDLALASTRVLADYIVEQVKPIKSQLLEIVDNLYLVSCSFTVRARGVLEAIAVKRYYAHVLCNANPILLRLSGNERI